MFAQVWLFWLAPIVGAILAGLVYRSIFAEEVAEKTLPAALTDYDFERAQLDEETSVK